MATYNKKQKENPTKGSIATVRRHIEEGSFSRLYLLFGEEPYLVNQYKKDLISALTNEGDTMNFTTYSADSFDMNSVMSDALTMPFLAEHRVVLVENSGIFDLSDPDFLSNLEQMPDTNVIIFSEQKVNKTKKAYQHTKKNELATCLEFNMPDMQTLTKWILGILSEDNIKVRATVPDKFFDSYGEDKNMYLLKNEATKLHDYCMEKGTIVDEDVELLCSNSVEDKIFDMCRFISEKNAASAISLYNDLVSIKTSPMIIISLIARQYNLLAQVKQMQDDGLSVKDISDKLKMNDYSIRQLMRICKNYTKREIIHSIDICYDLRLSIMNGTLTDKNAAEQLIVRLLV